MSSTFYITTPIYYVNARPHLGHAYTTIVADSLRRFHTLLGEDTWFLTGTDEHGDKIVKAAEAAGQTPQEFVDGISGQFQALWPKLGIKHDQFIRTTDADHKARVHVLLRREDALAFPMEHDDSHEDYITWLKILQRGGFAAGINKPYLKCRLSEGGKSRNKLKSAAMTYQVYKYMGYGRLKSLLFFASYAFHGVWKYR